MENGKLDGEAALQLRKAFPQDWNVHNARFQFLHNMAIACTQCELEGNGWVRLYPGYAVTLDADAAQKRTGYRWSAWQLRLKFAETVHSIAEMTRSKIEAMEFSGVPRVEAY